MKDKHCSTGLKPLGLGSEANQHIHKTFPYGNANPSKSIWILIESDII